MSNLRYAFMDGSVVAKRNLIKIKRVPDLLVFTTISPIMFVLLFAYVFGGSINQPGGVNYREFLIAGTFAQTVIFGATFTELVWPRTCKRVSSIGFARCRCRDLRFDGTNCERHRL